MRIFKFLKSKLFVYFCCVSLIFCAGVVVAEDIETSKSLNVQKNFIDRHNLSPLYLDVFVNKQSKPSKNVFLLQDRFGHIFVDDVNLQEWRIIIPSNVISTKYQDRVLYSLDDFNGVTYKINEADMALDVSFPPEMFSPQKIFGAKQETLFPNTPNYGIVLNYDLMADKIEKSDAPTNLNGLFSVNVFGGFGSFINEFIGRSSIQGSSSENETKSSFDDNTKQTANLIRLNTYWQKSNVEKMQTMLVGDTLSSSGLWGGSVAFLGFHLGSDFGVQPNFDKMPLLRGRGIANLPSTVDVYVNNNLVQQKKIDIGPFDIDSLPVTNGSGIVSIITTDIMGRQEIIDFPFYVSGSLLRPGLHEYSIDSGFVRNDYGIKSFSYGDFVTLLRDRKGVTDEFTREWRTELAIKQKNLGYSGSYLLNKAGIFDVSLVTSYANDYGFGWLAKAMWQSSGFDKIFNFGFNAQYTSYKMRYVGLDDNSLSPAFVGSIFTGLNLKKYGSLSLTYIQTKNREKQQQKLLKANDFSNDVKMLNLNYSKNLNKDWRFNVGISTNFSENKSNVYFISLLYSASIKEDSSISFLSKFNNQDFQNTFGAYKSLPSSKGFGYNVQINRASNSNSYNFGLLTQNNVGRYGFVVAQSEGGVRGYRLNATGSVVAMDKEVFFGRNTGENSFVIVKVPKYKNIGVYSGGRLIGKTNKNGKILISNIPSYSVNRISIDANDLPLNVKINEESKKVALYKNSGIVLEFPIKSSYGTLARLIQENGQAIPAGATVKFVDMDKGKIQEKMYNQNKQDNEEYNFPVVQNGVVYITDLNIGENNLQAEWDDSKCIFSINYAIKQDSYLPNLGDVICKISQ